MSASLTSSDDPSTSQSLPKAPVRYSIYSTKFPSNPVEILNIKKNIPSHHHELIQIVEIQNCPTTLDASKLISNSIFRSALESLKNFIILKLKIDEKLNDKYAEKPKIHEFKIKKNFLISYESSNASHKIIYWKNLNEFITIKLMEGYSAEMTDFVRDFLIDAVSENVNDSNIELTDLINSNGYNLLLKAVNHKEFSTLIDELLNLPFDINRKCNERQSAADIAWKRQHFEILLKLLEANSKFPDDFHIDELEDDDASEKIKKLIETCNLMHAAIKDNNLTIIQELIKEKSNLKYFYNVKNVSVATTAINAKKIEIYYYLLEKGCSTGPEEDFNQQINQVYKKAFEPVKKKIMLDITSAHDDASKQLPEKHLKILYANSVISHDDHLAEQRSKVIKEAYSILNNIDPITKQILQLASMHRNFKIHFDPNRTSIQFMNPNGGDAQTRGLYEDYDGIKTASLYIAAKELLLNDDDDKFAALGTFAHELCHFVMNLTFCNDAKPYAIDDEENKKKFSKIIEKCQELMEIEKIVSSVYNCYGEDLWAAELIVRVPHMIVHYRNDSQNLNALKVTFKELFDYYNDVVVPKMNQTMPMLEIFFNDSNDIELINLTDAYKAKIYNSNVKFQGIDVKFNEIIDIKNSDIFELLSSEQIRGILVEKISLSIGHAEEIKTKFYSERDFIEHDKRLPKEFHKPKEYAWPYEVSNYLLTFDQISSIADNKYEKMIILSDHAGEGKTTTFKHLSGKLKSKFPNYWISYINLKKYLKVYEKFEQNFQVLEVLREILSITDKLEVETFTKLFNSHKVILLYDGVDEITPKFKDFFIKLIDSVPTKIQQWIATRPQHMKELKEKFKQNAYNLMPYNDAQKIEFITNVLENQKIENINAEEVLNYINKMTSYENRIDSPLMLQMMTELYVNDKTTGEINKFSLYHKMIEMKKNIIAGKNEIVINDCNSLETRLTIWQVHQIYALKLIYKNRLKDRLNDDKTIDINDFQLLKRWRNEKSKWTPEQISRYGFLIVDNWNTDEEFPDFVHRSFAEFFIAQFAIQDLYELDEDEMSEKEIKLRVNLLIEISHEDIILEFISNFIDTHKSKRMHKHFLELITSKKMQKILVDFESYLIKIFSIDERFLKEFRFDDNKTIFQYWINEIRLDDIPRVVNIYKRCFGIDWIEHTGYPLNRNFSFQKYEEIDNILRQKSKYLYQRFDVINLIDQFVMPQNDILKFFSKSFYSISGETFRNSYLTQKLFEMIQNSLNDCKSEFLRICVNRKVTYSPLLNDHSEKNAKEFFQKLEEFLKSDDKICKDDLKVLISNLNLFYFGIEVLVSSYREEKLTKIYIQEFFIKNLEYVIDYIRKSGYEKLEKIFISFFKEIFDIQSERNQVKEFLEARFKHKNEDYNNHTILSYLSKNLKLLKSHAGKGQKFKLFQNTLLEMAKQIEITDDEIKKLSRRENDDDSAK